LGNGVTVAYRIFGYLVDTIAAVFQTRPILIRLYPASSERFGKLLA